MPDMTFFAGIEEGPDGRKIIVIPTKNYRGRQISKFKMCRVEITQIEE